MGNKIFKNFLWRFFERIGAQLISFVVTIVLARLLSPEAFGTVAIVTVFTAILQVFVDGGFGNALIQKKDADDIDFSSVFIFNIFFCITVYAVLFFFSPLIASFYENTHLINMIRVAGTVVLISGVKNVQQAYVSKHFMFKKFFYATTGGTLMSAVVGVFLAYKGLGAWALIFQQLSNALIDTIILWLVVPWRPKKVFDVKRIKSLFSYGYKLLLTSLLNTLYANFRQLLIGKQYSSSELAYYNRGKQFPFLIVTNVNASLDSVLFPAMAEKQDDDEGVINLIKTSIGYSTYFMWPFLLLMAASAESLIAVVLTSKWILVAPYLRIFCFVCMTYPIQTANFNALKAVGKSNVCLKLEIIESVIGVTTMLLVLKTNAYMIAVTYFITAIISTVFITVASQKYCGFSVKNQIKTVLKVFVAAVVMYSSIRFVRVQGHDLLTFIVQIIIACVVYIVACYLMKVSYQKSIVGLVIRIARKNQESKA